MMMVNDELRTWKAEAVAYFKVLS